MSEVLEALKESTRAKAAEAESNYWRLVSRVARNEEVDPGEVWNVCDATADKSLMDFEADTTAAEERQALVKQYAELPALQNKATALENQIAAKQDAFAIIAQKHSLEIQAMGMDLQTLFTRINCVTPIRRQLLGNPPANLAAKIKSLQTERSRLAPRLTEILAERQSMQNGSLNAGKLGLERQLEQAREAVQKLSGSKQSKANLAEAETALQNFLRNRWEPAQAEVEKIRAALATIESKLAAIEQTIMSGGV